MTSAHEAAATPSAVETIEPSFEMESPSISGHARPAEAGEERSRSRKQPNSVERYPCGRSEQRVAYAKIWPGLVMCSFETQTHTLRSRFSCSARIRIRGCRS